MYYKLKSNAILRNDINGVLLYLKEQSYNERISDEKHRMLDPTATVAFYLMDGTHTLEEIIKIVSEYFSLSESQSDLLISTITKLNSFYEILDEMVMDSNSNNKSIKNILPDLNHIAHYNMDASTPSIPLSLILIPTMSCMVDCAYCYADRTPKYEKIYPGFYRKLIKEACEDLQIKNITITGGDIFLFEGYKELLTLLDQYGYHPELPTKKPLSYEELKQLKNIGYTSYQISLDCLEPNVIRNILNIKKPEEYINQMLKTFKFAEDLDIKISVNIVLSKLNIYNLESFLMFLCNQENIYRVSMSSISYSLYLREPMRTIMLDKSDFEFMKNKYGDYFKKLKNKLLFFKEPDSSIVWGAQYQQTSDKYFERVLCSAYRTGLVILPDGKVTGCEQLYDNPDFIIGDATKQSLMEIWNSPKRKEIIYPRQESFPAESPCRYCEPENFKKCHEGRGRCWREILKFYDRHDFPDHRCPFYKDIAKKHNLKLKTHEAIWEI